jgi:hypothetical protein
MANKLHDRCVKLIRLGIETVKLANENTIEKRYEQTKQEIVFSNSLHLIDFDSMIILMMELRNAKLTREEQIQAYKSDLNDIIDPRD